MNSVFVDTGYLIASDASDDQHHRAGRAHWNKFSAEAGDETPEAVIAWEVREETGLEVSVEWLL